MSAFAHPDDDPETDSLRRSRSEPTGPGSATSDSREFRAFVDEAPVPTGVYVVEPDPLYRRIFRQTLGAAGYDVRIFETADELLSLVEPDQAGCLLFDADGVRPPGVGRPPEKAPGDSGASFDGYDDEVPAREIGPHELLARLAVCHSPLVAVAVVSRTSLEPAAELLDGGAIDVLERPVARSVLARAVRDALEDSAVRSRLRAAAIRLSHLPQRQQQVLRLTAGGWKCWSIGLRLGLWPGEVRRLREEIVLAMGVASLERAVEVSRHVGRRREFLEELCRSHARMLRRRR